MASEKYLFTSESVSMGHPDKLADQRLVSGVVQCAFQAGEMTARDVADFMGEHADNLRWPIGCHQQAGGKKYPLAAGNESVQSLVIDDMQAEILLFDSGCAEKWRSVCSNGMFDFGIADSGRPRRTVCQRHKQRYNRDDSNGGCHGGNCSAQKRYFHSQGYK